MMHEHSDRQTNLFGKEVVGKHGHAGAIGDEVCDGLHDVPGVLPPGQTGQDAKLQAHQPQPQPRQVVGALGRLGLQLLLHLNTQKGESYH